MRDKRFRLGSTIALAALLVALPVFASSLFMETGTVNTSGQEPILTKTGTLRIDARLPVPIENAVATLQESSEGLYTIVDSTVAFPVIDPGTTVESTDTFALEVDTSAEYSRSIPTRWLLDYEIGGEPKQVLLHVVLDVPEMDE